MNGYSWISGISIFCYLFLLVSFLSSKSRKGVMQAFTHLLVIMILWTGGSVGMRIQLWPSVYLWHHVSLLGMMLLSYGYYQFILEFLDQENHGLRKAMLVIFLLLFGLNCVTGIFIPLPEVVVTGSGVQFLYHYDWMVVLLIGLILLSLVPIIMTIWRCCRGNRIAWQQLKPVMIGIAIILVGNIASTLPVFTGLPVDMLSGAVNTIFIFYALYKKKLFRMTILLSKQNCIIIAVILGFVVFSDVALAINRLLINTVGLTYTSTLIIVAFFLAAMIAAMYFLRGDHQHDVRG